MSSYIQSPSFVKLWHINLVSDMSNKPTDRVLMPKEYAQVSLGSGIPSSLMPCACKTCSARKIRCDKIIPRCSNCKKSGAGCEYEAPPPRKKRKVREVDSDVLERLRTYERILKENDLFPPAERNNQIETSGPIANSVLREGKFETMKRLMYVEPEMNLKGRVLEGRDGETRFVGSRMWESLGEQEEFDEAPEEKGQEEGADMLSSVFVGGDKDLLECHPCPEDAMFLWKTHVERVEPICKILHIPSVSPVVETASQRPLSISKAIDCLLFAIYHFAILSLTEEECSSNLITSSSRIALLQRYDLATRQALTNVSFLQTSSFTVLQALALYLLSTKQTTAPQTYWILTGTAIRLAQKMGLHRDGTKLSLPPFETQMRRRLWYQLLPLDMWAGQMAGTGIAVLPETWDTEAPWNVNDGDIWPGMEDVPDERNEATEMMFCLARATLGRAFGASKKTQGQKEGVENIIRKAEEEVEEKYLRYCDLVDPLHFLTICSTRSGIAAMRLGIFVARHEGTSNVDQMRETLRLTQKIVDTDSAAVEHAALKRFQWHIRGLFVWGSWESLILNLQLLSDGKLDGEERSQAWGRVEKLFANHPGEMVESKRALHVAVRRLVLRAWDNSPLGEELELVKNLRNRAGSDAAQSGETSASTATAFMDNAADASTGDQHILLGEYAFDMSKQSEFDPTFDLDAVDWSIWNQLIQGDQSER